MKLATHLTYAHASLWGCTFKEAVIALLGLEALNVLVNLLMLLFFGTTVYTFIPGFMVAIIMTSPVLKVMGAIKKGKQEGYLSIKIRMWLNQHLHCATPYVNRVGYWSTKRTKRA